MQENEFEVFYNALSVGYHLCKIMEAVGEKEMTKEQKDRFIAWLIRHKIYDKE